MTMDTDAETDAVPAAPILSQPNPEDAMETDKVVALRTLSDLLAAFEIYKKHIVAHILHVLENPARSSEEKAALNLHYDRLCEFEGLIILVLVWQTSCYITDEDLFCANLSRKGDGLTRTSLGDILHATDRRPLPFSSPDMFTRRAARIVEAAMAFGLIEQQVVRQNLKLLSATEKLHNLLAEVGSATAVILHSPCLGV